LKGRPPKSPDRLQRRNASPVLALSAGERLAPPPPVGVLKLTRARWQTYWASELAGATRDAHIPIVERLFYRYDERERASRTVRKEGRITRGSQGQLVQHPLLKYIDACDAEIRQLEDRLGLSPRGMAQLGSSFATAQRSLDDLNRTLQSDTEEADDDSDPRVQIVG
jgi:P27 family predicted phage terminase small subunit